MLDTGGQAGSASADLGSSIGEMLGEMGSDSAPDELGDGTDAGAPPAEAPPAAPEPSPTLDAAPEVEPSTDAPVPATPDDTAPTEEADPLATSTPLAYTVDGQERVNEGIRVIGDEAIITREALPDVIRRLGERDHLFEQSQTWHQKEQRTDALGAWKHVAEDGTERLLTGTEGIAEMRVSHARLEAALNTLVGVLQDPAAIRQMIAVDENENIVLNQAFMDGVLTRSELAEIKAEQSTRSTIGQLQAAATTSAAPAPDFAKSAPAIIKQAAGDKLSALSKQDQDVLGKAMLRYVRPTTPAERQMGHGTHIVDAEFTELVQDRISLRSEGVKGVTTAAAAATSNAARLAAARQGAPSRVVPRPSAATRPAIAGETDADRAWNMRERAAVAASRR